MKALEVEELEKLRGLMNEADICHQEQVQE